MSATPAQLFSMVFERLGKWRAVLAGDRDKSLHHCISAAAALCCWQAAIVRDTTGCGKGLDADLAVKAGKA